MAPDPDASATRISETARALGFVRVGFVPVERFDRAAEAFSAWLDAGYHGEMAYLAGGDRADPSRLLGAARTLVVVVLPYARDIAPVGIPLKAEDDHGAVAALPTGSIARYALGQDYHAVMKAKLRALADSCAGILQRPVLSRACVDTAPLLEREAARRAGVGFTAKSTMTIVPGVGTYTLLGELLLDVEVAPIRRDDAEGRRASQGCGSCRRCLDACPTGAFVTPYVLDARRCIAYLTIELRGAIPRPLRRAIGQRVFGCDVCQDVCPYNGSASPHPSAPELAPSADLIEPDLIGLLQLGAAQHRRLVRGTALRRISRPRLARNAAIALGNSGDRRAVPPLIQALENDRSALVRGHAAWALGQLGGPAARSALERAMEEDSDASVRGEARAALADLDETGTAS